MLEGSIAFTLSDHYQKSNTIRKKNACDYYK